MQRAENEITSGHEAGTRTKIFTAALNSTMPCKAYAQLEEHFGSKMLVIAGIKQLTGGFSFWSQKLISEIKDKISRGYVVLIEEKTDYIAQYGSKFDFEAESPEGKVNLYTALDYYFALQNSGNLQVHKDCANFIIRNNIAEKLQDDKGRTKYSINWDQFTGGHHALLLCVMGAIMEPISERYLSAFLGNFNTEIQAQDDGLGTVRSLVGRYGIEVQHGI